MRHASKYGLRIVTVVAATVLLAACVISETRPVEYKPAVRAEAEVPEAQRLDVAVAVFDPGLPEAGSKQAAEQAVPNEVREAESRYIAYHLKETLERTGHWGAVRVVPGDRDGNELTVTGEILESTGEILEVEVIARDATGRMWLKRKYEGRADSGTYTDGELLDRDPFQNIYNEISNDLLAVRKGLTDDNLQGVRRVAELRFAQDLAPEAFATHLSESRKGNYTVNRLPADGDPMIERVRSVRERDYLFVDTLNEHYAGFYRQMDEPYDTWRRYSYDEAIALRELEAAARWRKLVGAAAVVGSVIVDQQSESSTGDLVGNVMLVGGIELFRQGMQVSKEAQMQADVLAELGTSFGAEIEPAVVDVAGETRRLEGSAATQYAEWRRLMRDIYESETGFDLVQEESTAEPVSDLAAGELPTNQ